VAQSVWELDMGWTIGVQGIYCQWGLRIFLFYNASRPALRSTELPIQWIVGAISLAVKWPGNEADYSHPSSAEVKEWVELYLHSPNRPSWRGSQLNHRDNFTFPYIYTYIYIYAPTHLTKCIAWSILISTLDVGFP